MNRPFEREFEGNSQVRACLTHSRSQVDILHVGRNEQAGYFYYVMELADDQQTGQQINPETYAAKSLKSELYRRSACLWSMPEDRLIAHHRSGSSSTSTAWFIVTSNRPTSFS